jgi:glutamate synthase (ferredoxin)
VALYGATSGAAFIRGVVGERFLVRNSGVVAVAEGCGDHGCEYMTGGTAVILGPTGKNFAAGMSGGTAYVLDQTHTLYRRLNTDMVAMEDVTKPGDLEELQKILTEYEKETKSELAAKILADFDGYAKDFRKIVPNDYKEMLEEINKQRQQGLEYDEAVLKAFGEVTSRG